MLIEAEPTASHGDPHCKHVGLHTPQAVPIYLETLTSGAHIIVPGLIIVPVDRMGLGGPI